MNRYPFTISSTTAPAAKRCRQSWSASLGRRQARQTTSLRGPLEQTPSPVRGHAHAAGELAPCHRRSGSAVSWLLLLSLAALAPAVEVTNLNDSGPGSLRHACGSKQVTFSPALAGKTITLASRIELRGDTIIDATAAPGVVISGGGKTRLFFVPMKAKVAFGGMTFTEAVNIDPDKGPGINAGGGAIYGDMYSEVTVIRCVFRGNKVHLHEGGGAAVFMSYHSKLLVSDCRFEDNVTEGGGERGGAVTLATNVTSVFRRSFFANNKGFTGGINNLLATMTVEDCVFENNEGLHVGGAIYTDGASEKTDDELGGSIILTRCRFVGNRSPGLGGACYLFLYPPDRLLVQGCVFDGNDGNHGGGFASGNGTMEVVDCAFVRNTALYGAGIWTSGSGKSGGAPLTVRNTLFALNAARGTCGGVSTETTDLLTLERCTFWKNTGGGGGAVQFWNDASQGKIIGSIFAENQSPIWAGGPAPTAEGVNIVWPSADVLPKGESVVRLNPQLEAVPQPEGKMPQVVPRASGMAGKVGASVIEDADQDEKGTAKGKGKPAAPSKPAASPRPGATALSKAIAAHADAPARDAAVAAMRAHLIGAGVGAWGQLPPFDNVVVQGGDERTIRVTAAGNEQSLPWRVVDDMVLLRLAQSELGSAPAQVRGDWIALACHLDLSREEVRKELEPLRATDPERFAMFIEILTGAEATPAQ